jgi:hypothetical protein
VIGAGPVILIVGLITVFGYSSVKWASYYDNLRDWKLCNERVAVTNEIIKFNDILVDIIEIERPIKSDKAKELDYAVQAIKNLQKDCKDQPTFLTSFNSNF